MFDSTVERPVFCKKKDMGGITEVGAEGFSEEQEDRKDESIRDFKVLLFKTMTCPNCKAAEKILNANGIDFTEVYADIDENLDLVRKFGIMKAPTLVVGGGDDVQTFVGVADINKWVKNSK